MAISTNLLVPGRGHNIAPTGALELSDPARERVVVAVTYYQDNKAAFTESLQRGTGGLIVMCGGYAALASSGQITAPPYHLRESTMMQNLAVDLGVPQRHLGNSPASTSTMENVLRAQEEGFFTELKPGNPLGIVAEAHNPDEQGQFSQYARLEWFARKIFKLPVGVVCLVPTQTSISSAEQADERKLMKVTRILYSAAKTPEGLRRAEKIAAIGSSALSSLGLQKPPVKSYTNIG